MTHYKLPNCIGPRIFFKRNITIYTNHLIISQIIHGEQLQDFLKNPE